MKIKEIAIISCMTLAIGSFVELWYKEFIILRFPTSKKQLVKNSKDSQKKTIALYFFKQNNWQYEVIDIISSDDNQETVVRTINAWFQLLEDELILKKKIAVQAAVITPNGQDLYLSFDRNPFEKSAPTFEKWYLVEAMLKTLRESDLTIKRVYFQVHYQPIHDYHLDFTNPWPIEGFINNNI